jgi:hypothetical protein
METDGSQPGLLRGAFRPLPPLRADNATIRDERIAAEQDMEARLAAREDADKELLLQQVTEGYEEQNRRADRSERRATMLLGAIGIVTTVVGATAGILGSSDLLDDILLRAPLGVVIVAVIAFFGLAALYALQVVTAADQWRRPATPTMLDARIERTSEQLFQHTVAALIDSSRWNQRIADRKAARLRRASRCFGYGLGLLLLLAVVFVAVSTAFPAEDKEQNTESARTYVHAAP